MKLKRTKILLSVFLISLLLLPGCKDAPKRTEEEPTERTAPRTTETDETVTEAPEYCEFSYDPETKTIHVTGTGNYDALKIPEEAEEAALVQVEDDDFELTLDPHLLISNRLDILYEKEGESLGTFLPGFLARTDRSITFLRDTFTGLAKDERVSETARKKPVITLTAGNYGFEVLSKKIAVNLNYATWHRELMYVFALLPSQSRGWEQLGYAWYLGYVLDPNNEFPCAQQLVVPGEDCPYYQIMMNAGISADDLDGQDILTIFEAASRYAIEKGLTNWWGHMDSEAVISDRWQKRRGSGEWYIGDQKMSYAMAMSFIAWLSERYGLETVTAFVCENKNFTEAFGSDYESTFEEWKNRIREKYPFVENTPEN